MPACALFTLSYWPGRGDSSSTLPVPFAMGKRSCLLEYRRQERQRYRASRLPTSRFLPTKFRTYESAMTCTLPLVRLSLENWQNSGRTFPLRSLLFICCRKDAKIVSHPFRRVKRREVCLRISCSSHRMRNSCRRLFMRHL